MEQYKVLLVDDEEEIRFGISSRTDWEGLGLKLVGEAENGAEALELAEQLLPDIVLTDIKMPFMDGLTLCKRLRSQLPTAKIIVFSGFDDFEYARRAIGMNVSQYILKPVNAQELREVLQNIIAELDKQQAERRNMEALRAQYAESLPVMRELFFTRLLDGHIPATQIQERAARYEILLPEGQWAVALIQAEPIQTADELLLISVRGLFEKHFSFYENKFHLIMYNDMIALLCSMPYSQSINAFIEELSRMCLLSSSYLGLALTIGVGRIYDDISKLNLSAEEARSALDYRVLSGSRVIYLGDIEPAANVRIAFEEADERALASAIKLYGEQSIRELLDSLMPRVKAAGTDLAQCQQFFFDLASYVMRLTRSCGIRNENIFGDGFTGIVDIKSFKSLEEAMEWCLNSCLQLHKQLHATRNDSNWRTVEQAKEYISQHFSDPELNVDALCGYLHLSPAYFSTIFKRETDMSFINYVTSLRMEAAEKLLQETDEKTYIIAEKIGYTDPNYFSYVFKRQFGVSPSKYRSKITMSKL